MRKRVFTFCLAFLRSSVSKRSGNCKNLTSMARLVDIHLYRICHELRQVAVFIEKDNLLES